MQKQRLTYEWQCQYLKKGMWRTLFCSGKSISIYFQVEAPIPKTKAVHPSAQKHVFGLDDTLEENVGGEYQWNCAG